MKSSDRAIALHDRGYNCAQAVACAFAEVVEVDEALLYNMLDGFGAGMGNTRGVCGAFSGAALIASLLKGDRNIENAGKTKAATYKVVGGMQEEFVRRAKALICREIKTGNNGRPHTACADCIRIGCDLVDELLAELNAAASGNSAEESANE